MDVAKWLLALGVQAGSLYENERKKTFNPWVRMLTDALDNQLR
jgi:hypothetical protein